MTRDFVIRNAEIDGRAGFDVRIAGGVIQEIGQRLRGSSDDLDARGGALIPGLIDHHIHVLALAAQKDSVALDDVRNAPGLAARIAQAATDRPARTWIRATGYRETMAGELTRRELDALAPHHRLRVQHQTGVLWILNSLALESLKDTSSPCVERDIRGLPTGKIWRGDAWLRTQISTEPPSLAPVGRRLAALGITAVTDASATTDAASEEILANARRNGSLPQRLTAMSAGWLAPPEDCAIAVGAVKILLDDDALPDIEVFVARIAQARAWRRPVAVHCVTAVQLALTLAAFEAAGSAQGDRVEHGGVIPKDAIQQLRALGLVVVTQPGFVYERGDRYIAEVPITEHDDLYRCGTLLRAGLSVLAGSDAPYADPDPWAAMRTAVARRTRSGQVLGTGERITAAEALRMYLGEASRPTKIRRIAPGAPADLCLLDQSIRDALAHPCADIVRASYVAGRQIFDRGHSKNRN